MDLHELESRLKAALTTFLGYPCNTAYDYSALQPFANVNINNVGCPFSSSTYKANTKDIERSVLHWFAKLWDIHPDNIWGYVTNGSTESNLQGLYVAREVAKASKYPAHIFFTSADSHYSLYKIARLLQLNMCVIPSRDNGEIDYESLSNKIKQEYQNHFLIINANLGTTMKGAMDNTREIYRILKQLNRHHDGDYYLHMDGALTGFYLPFIEKDLFFKSHVHSISISGHKFCGIHFPCGVFMMEKRFLPYVTTNIEYIGSVDATISGSRDGHAPIYFQYIIDEKGMDGFREDVHQCIQFAEHLEEHLPNAWRNQNSITVVFPRPSQLLIDKWQLATQGDISHVIVMPHVTKEKLDQFIQEYIYDCSFHQQKSHTPRSAPPSAI